jgi:hypothetical protein
MTLLLSGAKSFKDNKAKPGPKCEIIDGVHVGKLGQDKEHTMKATCTSRKSVDRGTEQRKEVRDACQEHNSS